MFNSYVVVLYLLLIKRILGTGMAAAGDRAAYIVNELFTQVLCRSPSRDRRFWPGIAS